MTSTTSRAAALVAAAVACVGTGLVLALAVVGGAQEASALPDQLNVKTVPLDYVYWVKQAGQVCPQISSPLIAAQIDAESAWNPRAKSSVGAEGLSQFMPGTWATWGVDADGNGTADPYSPPDAIMTQARYDCQLAKTIAAHHLPGDPTGLILAAYNAGPDAVIRYGGIPPYPETQQYVSKIEALLAKYTADEASGSFGQRVVAAAERQEGVPYVWGGGGLNGPTGGGFDCSGLTRYAVYQASGGTLVLPRTSQAQATAGTPVTAANLEPGDIIAFALHGPGDYDHIGIYAGGGLFWEAPQVGETVRESRLADPYYARVPKVYRRVG